MSGPFPTLHASLPSPASLFASAAVQQTINTVTPKVPKESLFSSEAPSAAPERKRPAMDIGFLCGEAPACAEPSAKRQRAERCATEDAGDLLCALRALEADARCGQIVDFASRFDSLARMLLHGTKLIICGSKHRITEVEFFFRGPNHQDPFVSCDDTLKTCGQWSFHKTAGKYRGGTYKGLDLTIGGPSSYGAILIRGLQEMSTGVVLDGPCVCVDHMLRLSNCQDIAQFVDRDTSCKAVPESEAELRGRLIYLEYHRPHKVVAKKPVMPSISPSKVAIPQPDMRSPSPTSGLSSPDNVASPRSPFPVCDTSASPKASTVPVPSKTILKTPRVGLTLKNHVDSKERFIMRHYRYLTTSRDTKKGKQFIVLAMHKKNGKTAGEVHAETGVGIGTIANYSELFEKGRERPNVDSLREVQLDTEELCELYGFCLQQGYV